MGGSILGNNFYDIDGQENDLQVSHFANRWHDVYDNDKHINE